MAVVYLVLSPTADPRVETRRNNAIFNTVVKALARNNRVEDQFLQ